jgi:hypothetical protein
VMKSRRLIRSPRRKQGTRRNAAANVRRFMTLKATMHPARSKA